MMKHLALILIFLSINSFAGRLKKSTKTLLSTIVSLQINTILHEDAHVETNESLGLNVLSVRYGLFNARTRTEITKELTEEKYRHKALAGLSRSQSIYKMLRHDDNSLTKLIAAVVASEYPVYCIKYFSGYERSGKDISKYIAHDGDRRFVIFSAIVDTASKLMWLTDNELPIMPEVSFHSGSIFVGLSINMRF